MSKSKYDDILDVYARRIWELEEAMMNTNPSALRDARQGKKQPMPPDPKDNIAPPQNQPQVGQQTPEAPQVPGDKP